MDDGSAIRANEQHEVKERQFQERFHTHTHTTNRGTHQIEEERISAVLFLSFFSCFSRVPAMQR